MINFKKKNSNDMKTLLVILSFLFPIVGLIAYFVRKNDDDDAGIFLGAGVAGFITALIFMI